MRLSLSLLPTAAILSASAHAQFEAASRGNTRTGHETFPPAVQLPAAPAGGSDACATAEALGSATGSVAYNLVGATTGSEGQTAFTGGLCNHGCAEYGTSQVAVLNDVWFSWTSPATGRVRLTTCPVQNDTKVAVYAGPVCPSGTTCIACSDDFHFSGGITAGLVDSILFFDATVGDTFLFQVGKSSFAGALPNFAGSFNIDVNPAHSTTGILDDNLAENDIGAGAATAGNLGINRLGNVSDSVVISGIRACWGGPGSTHVNGTPATVALWTDPNSDGNPTDAVLVESVNTTVQNANSDTFVDIPFTGNHTVNGVYFIGYGYQRISATNFPLTIDNSTCDVQPDTAWTVINVAAPANLATLAANSTPPTRLQVNCQAQSGGNNGLWRSAFSIRPILVTGPTPIGTPECFGDGTGAACPCANSGAAGRGCASFPFSGGALLKATGVAQVSADSVVLTCSEMAGPGLFFQANANLASPVPFGDGLLCSGVGIIRMGVVFPTAGTASYPGGLTPNPVSVAGAPVLSPTPTKHYQCWYRDANVFCTTSTFNTSNGLEILWGP
jgi:hypothetical protein